MGRKPGGRVRRIVIRLHKLLEVLWPLGLLFRGQGSKQIMQRAIESLALRVATGVVWSGPGLLDAIELTKGFHQLRLKVPALVTGFSGIPRSAGTTREPTPWPLSLPPGCASVWSG